MGRVLVCLLWALLVAGPSFATTFSYSTGQVTVSAVKKTSGALVLSSTNIGMSGNFVDFDAGTIDLTDFLITIPTSGIIDLDGMYGVYDQFRIESASISPGVGYGTFLPVDLGGGDYSFIAGPLDINGIYSAFDSTLTYSPALNLAAPFTDTALINGTININTGTLTLSGITLAEIPGGPLGESEALQIKADIVFVGVPEPTTAALLGLGLVGIASIRRRNLL